MATSSAAKVGRKWRHARAAVSNGSELLPGIDGRSLGARRYRDIVTDLVRDLGGSISIADMTLVRQVAVLTVEHERMAASVVRGEPVDHEQLTRIGNSVARIMRTLGLHRGHGGKKKRLLEFEQPS